MTRIENLMSKMAVICLLMLAGVVSTSCSDDDDEAADKYQYIANGSLRGSTLADVNKVTGDYFTAIEEVMDGSYKEQDGAVIKACDAVYARHQSQGPTVKGSITLIKHRLGDSEANKQVLKTYEYK